MIKMIAGVYGYREAELVKRGLAVYANLIIPEEEPEPAGQNDDGSQNDEDGQKQKPEYSEKMKLPELQALAASYGLDAQKMRAKAEVVKLLDDYFKDDNEQPPSFGAIDPVE